MRVVNENQILTLHDIVGAQVACEAYFMTLEVARRQVNVLVNIRQHHQGSVAFNLQVGEQLQVCTGLRSRHIDFVQEHDTVVFRLVAEC